MSNRLHLKMQGKYSLRIKTKRLFEESIPSGLDQNAEGRMKDSLDNLHQTGLKIPSLTQIE